MGKGDKKTRRGKIIIGSYGKKRKKKENISTGKPKKVEVKEKPFYPANDVAAKPKVGTKPKTPSMPKPARPAGGAEVKEKAADKPKAESNEKTTSKKPEPKAKPKKE